MLFIIIIIIYLKFLLFQKIPTNFQQHNKIIYKKSPIIFKNHKIFSRGVSTISETKVKKLIQIYFKLFYKHNIRTFESSLFIFLYH